MSRTEEDDGKAVEEAREDCTKDAVLVEENVLWFLTLRNLTKEQVRSPLDLLSFLLHCFMLELGFQGEEEGGRLGEHWSGAVGHVTRYWLSAGDTARTPDILLTVTTLGHTVKVHGTHSSVKTSFTTSKLSPKDFVTSRKTQQEEEMEPKNLRQLARVFKNEVGVPLLNCARAHLGLPVSGLQGLPPELALRVLYLLPVHSVVSFSAVSKQLRLLCQDPALWKKLYVRNFGKSSRLETADSDWLRAFREEFLVRRERKKFREQNLARPPLFPFPDPGYAGPLHPLGPPVPGMLGGDYDRYPAGGGLPLFGGHTLDPTNFLPRPRFDPPGPRFPHGGGNLPGGGFGGGFF